ncbi:hypothetical protein CKAN_00989800 [Cinnamomum micranthum f. kanehirae]|uniref:Uncharacterized protein n=1 Tax=Cinnamomum micranthum f. kanehirae TaxID=337451 RepID=A0A3S4NT02_9MAGN|nr:hypothetical protein CKAN_00989800 [Cinnamomum micranthum f. kanehirae]
MHTSSSDQPKESLQIMQDEKFFSRILSKESSMANPSCRVYYGVAPGAVPFMWESQPGTPKNTISTTSIPPLTPPPSYLYNQKKNHIKKHPRPNLLHNILPRLTLRKSLVSPSSSSFSSSSPISSPSKSSNQSFSSWREEDCLPNRSPTSPACFGCSGIPRVSSKTSIYW